MCVKISLFLILGLSYVPIFGFQQMDSLQLNCQKKPIINLNFEDLQWMFRERAPLENQVDIPISLAFYIQDAKEIRLKNFSFSIANEDRESLFAFSNMTDNPILVWRDVLAQEIEIFSSLKDSLFKIFKPRGFRLRFLQGERGLASQMDLLNRGRSKTALSLHNFNLAVDVGIYRRGRYLKRSSLYTSMGHLAKKLGAFWGGDFVGFSDVGHIQAFINGAELVKKFPELAFEYVRFKEIYEQKYFDALAKGQENLVEDSRQLILELNKNRVQEVCACSKAIPIPKDLPVQWFNQFKDLTKGYVYVNQQSGWVYIKYGDSGYFYPLGVYVFETKN